MLFVKYLNDMHKEHLEEYKERYSEDEERVKRAMSRERFILDETATFDYLYENSVLIKAPRDCIDYVVLHELIHFIHH